MNKVNIGKYGEELFVDLENMETQEEVRERGVYEDLFTGGFLIKVKTEILMDVVKVSNTFFNVYVVKKIYRYYTNENSRKNEIYYEPLSTLGGIVRNTQKKLNSIKDNLSKDMKDYEDREETVDGKVEIDLVQEISMFLVHRDGASREIRNY